MSKTQKMLEEAIEHYGVSDKKTIRLSEKRDIEIVEQQRAIYENWKRANIKEDFNV